MFHKMPEDWPRREYFTHYMHDVRCTFSATVPVDVTRLRQALKDKGLKAYPAQIYMLASVVNQMPEFRMGLAETGEPGYWDSMHPAYTILNPKTKTFSEVYTPWQPDFAAFYRDCLADTAQYQSATCLAPRAGTPPNIFNISSIPWLDFTAFNLNVYTEGTYLAPIFTLGQYVQQAEKCVLPLAMQLHHAACDGWHAGQFVEALRAMADKPETWL